MERFINEEMGFDIETYETQVEPILYRLLKPEKFKQYPDDILFNSI